VCVFCVRLSFCALRACNLACVQSCWNRSTCVCVCFAAPSHSRTHEPLSCAFLLSFCHTFCLPRQPPFSTQHRRARMCAAGRLLKTVSRESLLANGLAGACQREIRFPFSYATQVMARAMNSVDPAHGGCPAVASASADGASSDRVVRGSEESVLPIAMLASQESGVWSSLCCVFAFVMRKRRLLSRTVASTE
jgi:hypothetical protein